MSSRTGGTNVIGAAIRIVESHPPDVEFACIRRFVTNRPKTILAAAEPAVVLAGR